MEQRSKAGIGISEDRDSFKAGAAAAQTALRQMKSDRGSAALAFCTGRHNYERFFEGVRFVLGEIPIIGGPAIGIIANDFIGYEGFQGGVAILPSDVEVGIACSGGLNDSEEKTGLSLAQGLNPFLNDDKNRLLCLFYDSIRKSPPPTPVMNVSTNLLNGILRNLKTDGFPIVGAGLLGGYNFQEGKIYCGGRVAGQHAAGALFSGAFDVYTTIMHGCVPISDYHSITRADGAVVYEIDNRPALDVLNDLIGKEWQRRMPLLLVTLGVNHGEKYGAYREENYVNRLVLNIIPEKKAIVLFESDLKEGTEFQFMRRNAALMSESARKRSREAAAHLRKKHLEPFLAFYIDCAGRNAELSGMEHEEAAVVREALGGDVPFFGIYSGVEIAPLLGKPRGLDWTGVLVMLSRKRE